MQVTRRTALAVLVLGLSGCAASPVVSGTPALAPSSPPPTQAPEDAAAQAAVARLESVLNGLATLVDPGEQAWSAAALQQCAAHLELLQLPDPFGPEGQEPFVVETPESAFDSAEAGNLAFAEQLPMTVDSLESAAASADAGDLRLLYASAATGAAALGNRSVPPAPGAVPVRLQPTTVEASLPIALGHAWALIHGLGVGLGRLASKDPLHAVGTARLPIAKGLRNDLRAAIVGEVPEQPAAFELPNAMSSPDEIRAAWASLETNLMEGYARLVAASDEAAWRLAMRAQVEPVQAVGGALGFWPGWVD